MYETYVPIRVERKPPTIAEIVRQKTDDGARIIDFFLDVMEGRVDGAMLCHRIDAAKQLVKYGSKKAADFIAEHGDETCDHCESRKRGPAKPRPRKDTSPAAGPLHAGLPHTPGPYGYDFLTLLTEDFLTVLSAVDEDLMIKLLRAQTRDGGTVIDFLDAVMHGREDGFRVNHRISAARELISHILRDEHAFAHAVLDEHLAARALLDNVGADPRVRPLSGSETPSPSTLTPSPSTGEGWGEGDSPDTTTTTVVPAKAGFLPQEPSPTQRGGEGRVEPADEPVLSTVAEPVLSTAEGLVEGPAPYPIRGQRSGDSTVPGPAANEADLTAVPAESLPHTRYGAGTQGGGVAEDKDEKPAPVELTPAERRINDKLEAHRHEPDGDGAPIDSTHPGRSPPW